MRSGLPRWVRTSFSVPSSAQKRLVSEFLVPRRNDRLYGERGSERQREREQGIEIGSICAMGLRALLPSYLAQRSVRPLTV